jgi:hypothetical protein
VGASEVRAVQLGVAAAETHEALFLQERALRCVQLHVVEGQCHLVSLRDGLLDRGEPEATQLGSGETCTARVAAVDDGVAQVGAGEVGSA